MSVPQPRATTRLLLPRFAAHLAHLLNTGEGDLIEIKPFALDATLRRTLAGKAGEPHEYREVLLGFAIVSNGAKPDEVADRYLGEVIGRRLFLARANLTHKGHELFLALCRRGAAEGWQLAVLARRREGAQIEPDGGSAPSNFPSVADRLGQLDQAISPGNPAATAREKHGPLVLAAGSGAAETPEEMSLWAACVTGPMRLKKISDKAAWDEFCSLVIKAVEAAHEPYGKILALGLSPFDCAGELSVNTAKLLGTFLAEVRRETEGKDCSPSSGPAVGVGGGGFCAPAAWHRVWERRKVPGFASVEELWNSEWGRMLRQPKGARLVEQINVEDLPDVSVEPGDDEVEAGLQDDDLFEQAVTRCGAAGIISAFDAWLIRAIRDAESIAQLAKRPEVRKHLNDVDLNTYVAELTERVLDWVRRRHPDKGTK